MEVVTAPRESPCPPPFVHVLRSFKWRCTLTNLMICTPLPTPHTAFHYLAPSSRIKSCYKQQREQSDEVARRIMDVALLGSSKIIFSSSEAHGIKGESQLDKWVICEVRRQR